MTPPVSREEVQGWVEAASRATPGSWRQGFDDGSGCVDDREGAWINSAQVSVVRGGRDDWGVPVGVERATDAEFIALSRDAVPRLASALAEAMDALNQADQLFAGWSYADVFDRVERLRLMTRALLASYGDTP